ncbi:MAG: cyclic nucleotide-binding domain-containing protein [Eubacteriales bacterium]|nr:cyclic nucleotide-binding domain-containing protein [Eubacteriales bacterium]
MLLPSYLFQDEFSEFYDVIMQMPHTEKKYLKGETIIGPGSERPCCFFVLEGLATFSILHESGRSKTSTFRGRHTIFPLYYSYSSTIMEQCMEVTAFTDILVAQFSRQQIYTLMVKYSGFALNMVDCYCKYATTLQYDLTSQMFDNTLMKTSNFLYIYLKYMNKKSNNMILIIPGDQPMR